MARVDGMEYLPDVVQPSDIPAIARTLGRAFVDDPVFKVLFGDPVPPRPIARFFAVMADVQLHHGFVHRTPGNEAAAIWAPPDEWKMPVVTIVRKTPQLAYIFRQRLLANLGVLTEMEKAHPQEPHYYLEFVGVDPAHQGKGFGAQILQPMLDRCDREGLPAYLESSNEANLAFYHRLGFDRRQTLQLKVGPTLFTMWRNPR
jgi:GNAT superfamily N-acetyltransferase